MLRLGTAGKTGKTGKAGVVMRPPAPPPLLANSLLVLVTLAFVFEMHRGNDLATAILGVAFFGVCVTWKGGSVWRR